MKYKLEKSRKHKETDLHHTYCQAYGKALSGYKGEKNSGNEKMMK